MYITYTGLGVRRPMLSMDNKASFWSRAGHVISLASVFEYIK